MISTLKKRRAGAGDGPALLFDDCRLPIFRLHKPAEHYPRVDLQLSLDCE